MRHLLANGKKFTPPLLMEAVAPGCKACWTNPLSYLCAMADPLLVVLIEALTILINLPNPICPVNSVLCLLFGAPGTPTLPPPF